MNYVSLTENHLFSKTYRSKLHKVTGTVAVYVLKDYKEKEYRLKNPQKTSINRVGISASKKIGGAVERNRAKRVIREAYRQIDRQYGIRTGYLIVIAAREKSTEVKVQDVMRDMQYALTKLDMLKCTDGIGATGNGCNGTKPDGVTAAEENSAADTVVPLQSADCEGDSAD